MKLLPIVSCLLVLIGTCQVRADLAGSPCPHALKINTNSQFRGSLHFICLQRASRLPKLEVIQYQPRRVIVSEDVYELGTEHLASFVDHDGFLRILTAVPNRINGTSMYSVDPDGPKVIEETHTINTQFVNSMAIWKLDLNFEWQLAIANQPYLDQLAGITNSRAPLPEARPMITLHSWRATYFDSYQVINLPPDVRVNKLEPMNINGQEFLVVALEPHRYGYLSMREQQQETESLVYKLDFALGDLRWDLFQPLNSRLALDARSFIVAHKGSLQRDYYVALLGQPKSHLSQRQLEQCGSERGLIIYKYLGDRFVCYRSIAAPEATKLDAITYGQGDSYVLIALLSAPTNQVQLYLFDGLALRPLPSPMGWHQPPMISQRPRRTMDQSSFHLFMAPPVAEQINETSKRTLEPAGMALPALALAGSPQLPGDGKLMESVYHIPVDDAIRDAEGPTDEAHTKRDYVGQDLLAWCKQKIDDVLRDNFDTSAKQLLGLPRVNQQRPIEVNGDLIVEGDLSVSNLLYANRVAEGNVTNLDGIVNVLPTDFSATFDQIQQVHLEIDGLKRRVERILVDDGSVQDVFAPITFETVILDCIRPGLDPRFPGLAGCPQVDEIRTVRLNAHDISGIAQQALLTGRSWKIAQNVRFEHLILRGAVDIHGPLNGLLINDIVFKNGPPGAPILGHKEFRSGLYSASNLQVDFWNNQQVDRTTHLTSSGIQRVDAHLLLSRVVIESTGSDSSRIHLLNGLYLDNYLSQIALADDDNKFELPLEIGELHLVGPVSFTPNSRLSGVDLEDQWKNTMFKQSNQNVTAPMNFLGQVFVSFGGDILVDGLVNGLVLQPALVMMVNRDYLLQNPVVFTQDVFVRELLVNKALNGIQVTLNPSGQRELSILLDGGEQQLSADKVLTQVGIGGLNEIYGNINGNLNLSQLHQLAYNNGQQHHFSNIRFTGNNLRIADNVPVHIDATIDGYPIGDICQLALRVAQSPVIEYDRLRFEQPVHFKSLRCSAVGGFNDLTRSFLTRYGDQHITSVLKLANGLFINTTFNLQSSLNGLDVRPLLEAVAREASQNRTGHRDHYGDLYLDELVADRINELSLASVFLARADAPQIIRAPMSFDHLDIENVLVVDTNLATNSFNGLNVSDIFAGTLQYDAPQVIYSPVQVNTLHLLPGGQFLTRNVNGFDLRRLYADSVLADVDQVILGAKQFLAPVELMRAYTQFGLDGLTNQELRQHLLVHGDELIDDDLELLQDVLVKKELVIASGLIKELQLHSGLVSEIDVGLFVKTMIDRTAPGVASVFGNGTVWFKDVKTNNLKVGGTIQGLDVSRDAVTRPPPIGFPSTLAPVQQGTRYPPIFAPSVTPRPLSRPDGSLAAPTWAPKWQFVQPPRIPTTQLVRPQVLPPPTTYNQTSLIDHRYLEHLVRWQSEAIRDLSGRVNRLLSVSFYYEIAMKHPGLGPALHIGPPDSDMALLYLKATERPGEPCLVRGQTVAIMTQQRQPQAPMFTQSSSLQETSNPTIVDSLLVVNNQYLFVLDTFPEGQQELVSQVLVYLWDHRLGMYELRERVNLDGFATALRAFKANNLACFALATPRVTYGNYSGWPSIHCQAEPLGDFWPHRMLVPMQNVFDLDVATWPAGSQVIIAALSHSRGTDTQMGELNVLAFDVITQQVVSIASRPMISPLKLHLFRSAAKPALLELAVSEAITSSDGSYAMTRIFALERRSASLYLFQESQLIKDVQFHDIKSVRLDQANSLLFFQSANSISVYAPQLTDPHCAPQYSLVHRLPTRGANRFLVFATKPAGHILVLSKDGCEQLDYATLVLKAIIKH